MLRIRQTDKAGSDFAMANPSGPGNKFVSVNLNKSYGQPSHHHPNYSSSAYGQGAANRARNGSHGGGGGGSGMVVLSRPRSSQKAGPKLSVPPPLNLPSLRKEHERFDLSGPGGGSASGSGSGGGARPTSSGMGWSKPSTIEKDGKSGVDTQAVHAIDQSAHGIDSVTKGNSAYMPPSARSGGVGPVVPASTYQPPVERAMVLRGEDFPSLKAALPVTSGIAQKQKDSLHQKPKHVAGEETSDDPRDDPYSSSFVHMRPQGQNSQHSVRNSFKENGGEDRGLGSSHMSGQARKHEEYFPGPLPLVRLNPRSDWADDERDTGLGITDRGRDHGFPKFDSYWDDMPRSSVLPNKPPSSFSDRRVPRDDEAGKAFSSEVPKMDPYRRDVVRTPSKEGSSWRKDGITAHEDANERNALGVRSTTLSRESDKESKYNPPAVGDNVSIGGVSGHRESAFARREMGHGQDGRQHLNHSLESIDSRGAERNIRERYGSEQSNRSRGDFFQNKPISKFSVPSSGKAPYMKDKTPSFGRDKHSFSRNERSYLEDPFLKDFGATPFDERDPFTGNLVAVIKRKRDAVKQTDFNDPVRESFEAELERVQKLQEQERQRVIEEQEKAMEQARREEEERQRLIREEEERRRRLEDEAREAAWKAEQEQLEAVRRAEELRIAREEEKRRIFMEEERRKQAAKQKLLELEAKIAKRHSETSKGDAYTDIPEEKVSEALIENDAARPADLDSWEDSERMVERITNSASSDSSGLNRPFDISSRPQPPREGSSSFQDRGKHNNSWRRDAFDTDNSSSFLVQDQENDHHSPKRDVAIGGRAFPRKELYGGNGHMSSRMNFKGGMQPPPVDDFPYLKGHRWNPSGDGDQYGTNMEYDCKSMTIDSEFNGNLAGKYGDAGWGQGRSRLSPRSPYPDRLYPNPEVDELYTYGRSRYAMRQPRVLPPPIASVHRTSLRGEFERPGPSTFVDEDLHYDSATRNEPTTGYYVGQQETLGSPEIDSVRQETTISEDQKLEESPSRCDSQSSLSVSSPPSSPTPLSHDDLDECGECPVISAVDEGKQMLLSGNESVVLKGETGKDALVTASSSIPASDDEEWAIGNNDDLQEQEEYDEDEDGYQEEDEVHEEDDENITQEFKDLHLREEGSYHLMDNLVLGFDEGVEVGIPTDEFDRNLRDEESTFRVSEISVGVIDDQRPVDSMIHDGQSLQSVNNSPQVVTDSSVVRIQETEMASQGSIVQPTDNAPHTSMTSNILDSVTCSTSVHSGGQTVLSPVTMASHFSGQSAMSTVPSGLTHSDLPVKLQFGLFSGPPLIPSPIPAIQIGSIQMPLHLNSPVGQSLTNIHSSQPPIFQFGQLRYTTSISQGILPMTGRPMSFVQPNIQASYNLIQNSGSSLSIQSSEEASSRNIVKDDVPSHISKSVDPSHKNVSMGLSSIRDGAKSSGPVNKSQVENSVAADDKMAESYANERGKTVLVNNTQSSNEKGSEGQLQNGPASSQSGFSRKDSGGLNAPGPSSASRGRKTAYPARNSGSRSYGPVSEASRPDSIGYQRRPRRTIQRTEFRVRENVDRKQMSSVPYHNNSGYDDRPNFNRRGVGIYVRSGSKKSATTNKPLNNIVESEGSNLSSFNSQDIHFERKGDKGLGKEAYIKSENILNSGEGNLKRNICPEEDVDAPMQSGVVRVFKQPGIEAASDEDDFIQVRSKRQMLNDRREQREKEIKAKSRITKAQAPRKPRSAPQSAVVPTVSTKVSASLVGEAPMFDSDFAVSDGRVSTNLEASTGFSSMVSSQPLAPIGTPAVNTDTQADKRSHVIKSLQTGSVSAKSSGKSHVTGIIFETKNKVLDNVQTSMGSWDNPRMDKQVMALTQTQLDDAMKPARFDGRVASSSVSEPIISSPSILTKDKTFSCTASPINSLLAGEKIQFGAVTSPTVLPLINRAVSHGIGAPGSGRSDNQNSHNLSPNEKERTTLFFEKDKSLNDSSRVVHLEDRQAEAEAEAAASAVAVAAISSDEIVGNGLGACSVSVSDTKSFGDVNVDGAGGIRFSAITPNNQCMHGGQQLPSQSKAEESLCVALPADLSVENPPISLWPPLPSPQNSSSQMLSHFSGGTPSHVPYFDMNHPMLGGPIFAFGPHDDSLGPHQSQPPQKGTASSCSGPMGGSWQQCHSGVDSFYGPPTGFAGPFMSSPGGIPGVQGPQHMVVYNHFAPMGQFGQVGLGFMGATYIPSAKQPVWKHNPTSSAMSIGVGEGDLNNMNIVSAQRNSSNMPPPPPVHHLAPGSSLLPMASPLAMFDVSPFQGAHDMSVQARWSHVPGSPLQHSVAMPLQQQQQLPEGVPPPPPQFSHHGHPADQSVNTNNRFPEPRTSSTPSENNSRGFPVATISNVVGQFPNNELGMVVDPSNQTTTNNNSSSSGSTAAAIADGGGKNGNNTQSSVSSGRGGGNGQNMNTTTTNNNAFKVQQQKNSGSQQQYGNNSGGGYNNYNNPRVSHHHQKNNSSSSLGGGDWPQQHHQQQRRMGMGGGGFHGRNQSLDNKGFPSLKMKQIYVAKQQNTNTATATTTASGATSTTPPTTG